MFLGEPPRSQYDLSFSFLGIPVRIHPMFWVIALVLGLRSPDLVSLLAWVAAVFVGILVHELGHALAMRAYGFYPWITLHGFGGLTSHGPTSSYRSAGYGSLGQIVITAAGPGAGFLLAALIAASLHVAGYEVVILRLWKFIPFPLLRDIVGSAPLTDFITKLIFISVLWGFINLLPVYPLDGGQISREVLVRVNPRDGVRFSLILSVIVASAMALTAMVQWNSLFTTLLFAYLAYSSFVALQSHQGRGPF